MKRVDFTIKLQASWKEHHFKYLQRCFIEKQDYFKGSFSNISCDKSTIIVDKISYTQEDIKKILTDYFCNDTKGYQSCFGDVVQMFFTNLVEKDVDILWEIEKNDIFKIGNRVATGILKKFRRCKYGVMDNATILEVTQNKVLLKFDYYEIFKPLWVEKAKCYQIEKRLLHQASVGMQVFYIENTTNADIVEAKIVGTTVSHFKLKALDGRRAVQRTGSNLYLLKRLY